MKKIFLILFVLPFILFGQEQSPCYSVNDYNISILENNPPLTMNLNEGWNMIGYPCVEPMQVEDALISIVDELLILKDNYGDVYWPEYGFNGIGSLKQLNGYQINLHESVDSFSFCSPVELIERNGCTDCEAFNFDIWATSNDGTCIDVVEGCTDATAFNYNAYANTDDGSCEAVVEGCTDATAFNYNSSANTEFDPTNCEAFVLGCMDSTAYNYNTVANTDDDSCEDAVEGCTDQSAYTYNPTANSDNGSCVFYNSQTSQFNGGCDFENYPLAYVGNTRSSMSIMLLPEFINSLNVTNENAHINVKNQNGLVIGSLNLFGVSEASFPIWGDDSATFIVDGAFAGEVVSFQIFDGIYLSDIIMPSSVNFTPNGVISISTSASIIPINYPSLYEGNTGANMTVMLLPEFINSLNVTNENAYLVALNQNGLVIGSLNLFGVSQASFPIWGDDSETTDLVDGALANEVVNFQLVDGTSLNDVTMPAQVVYAGNGLSIQSTAAELTQNYNPLLITNEFDNPGSNMTVILLPEFINSLNVTNENAYLVALNQNGLVIGSLNLFGVSQASLLIWGDDSSTLEIEGGLINESISFQLVDGYNLYDVMMPLPVSFVDDGIYQQNMAATFTINQECTTYACPYDVYLEYIPYASVYDIEYCVNLIVEGCTNQMYLEYNTEANVDDGSCAILIVQGCIDQNYFEFNPEANVEDGSCEILIVQGCTNPFAINYNQNANFDDGNCELLGCMELYADNYNPEATLNDDSCIYYGCLNPTADNFDPSANTNDSTCIIYGCALSVFPNYNSQATIDDGSCDMSSTDVFGCANSLALNYNPEVTSANGSCEFDPSIIFGCTNPLALNYNPNATNDIGNCIIIDVSDFSFIPTTTDNTMSVVFPAGTLNDFIGGFLKAFKADGTPVSASSEIATYGAGGIAAIGTDAICGCDYLSGGDQLIFAILMNDQTIVHVDVNPPLTYAPNMFEMVSGSLEFTIDGAPVVVGCMDDYACNYDASANVNEGEGCEYAATNLNCDGVCLNDADGDGVCDEDEVAATCGDVNACNYTLEADDVTTDIDVSLCTYPTAENLDCDGVCLNDTDGDGVCEENEVEGCLDPNAYNFNPNATNDNGNCFLIDVSDFDFEPVMTDNNMSVVFPSGTLNDFIGGSLMAFATHYVYDDYAGVAPMGTDAMCACDYMSNGDQLIFAILMNDQTIVHVDVNPPLTYAPNMFEMVSGPLEFTIDGAPVVFGCTDSDYLEYQGANLDDGSCANLIIIGCMDSNACNYYDYAANVDDGSCTYPEAGFDCDGVCLNDCDADGICDFEEVAGCTDPTAFNYNSSATGAGCSGGDTLCVSVIWGCMNPAAENFDSAANTPNNDLCYYY
jgi:hypothetical protein